jgi:hypothetical protein
MGRIARRTAQRKVEPADVNARSYGEARSRRGETHAFQIWIEPN